jgi:uncharacterized membrane protein
MKWMQLEQKKSMKWIAGIVLAAIFVVFLYQLQPTAKPQLVNTNGRTFEEGRVVEVLEDNLQEDGSRIGDQKIRLQMESGNFAGEVLEATSANGFLFGAVCQSGTKVIAIVSQAGSTRSITVYSLNRSLPVYAFIAFFFLMLGLIGGKKGVKSALALLFTLLCLWKMFLPLIFRGVSPVWAAIFTAFLTVTVSLSLIGGCNKKTLAAVFGSFFGLFVAGASALLFGYCAGLSGYNVSNIEALLFVGQNTKIDIGGLLFAGVLISTLGAVMDIAMDIAAAIAEIHAHSPELCRRKLFASGMNVGRDIMGTMATTLILAFTGSSLGVLVLNYVYDLPYLQVINSNTMNIEIMQGLAGSFGVVFTVPLVSAIAAFLLATKQEA